MSKPASKEDIKKFWKSLYSSLYDDVDRDLTRETLFVHLNELEDMFRYQGHLAVVEMPLENLEGKFGKIGRFPADLVICEETSCICQLQ